MNMENKGHELGVIAFKHSGNAGDIIAAMAGIRACCGRLGAKARILLRLNTPAHYYMGAGAHPVQHEGRDVMLNQRQVDMLKPLLEAQDYVDSVAVWDGVENVHVDLDRVRGEVQVGMPHTPIQHWYGYAYPDMMCDVSEKWMDANANGSETAEGLILINRTARYTNEFVDFGFMKGMDGVVFTGLKPERDDFEARFGLNLPLLHVANFLDLARSLQAARFVICNQSFVYNLCEALKVPRIMEVCPWAANCMPVGRGGVSYMHQQGLEYWVGEYSKMY